MNILGIDVDGSGIKGASVDTKAGKLLAEARASDAARQRHDLSWKKYAKRLDVYLKAMEKLFWPDLFIIGGVSKEHDKFLPLLTVDVTVVPAQLLNDAGIVGAAMAAQRDK
jgi:polyphosphate glucokinase